MWKAKTARYLRLPLLLAPVLWGLGAAGCYADRAPATTFHDAAAVLVPDAGTHADGAGNGADRAPTGTTDTAAATGGADGAGGGGTGAGTDTALPPPSDDSTDPDTDIALVRFNPDGTLDTSFGTDGVARVDFGPGSGATRDALAGISLDALDRFILFGAKKGTGTRIDFDRVVARLTPAGVLDTTFATAGLFTSTFTNLNLNDQSRGGLVQSDGKILGVGYTVVPTGVGTQTSNRLVLFRLWGGVLDTTFGLNGIANLVPFLPADFINTQWGTFEPAAVATQSTGRYLTTGFGRAASAGEVNLVTLRHTPDGALDPTWGASGVQQLDIARQNDRGRNLMVLPDDRVIVVGSGSPRANVVHPLVALLGVDGALDTSFNQTGFKLYDFGYPSEELYGAALSPDGNWLAAVGFTTATGATADATLVFVPLTASAGPEVAKAVPISRTTEDRFWTVTFDARNRAYAAGFMTEEGDSRMVLARYNTDGTLDASFGRAGGVVTINVVEGGGTLETVRSVVMQSDGKVVIAGEIEHR